MQEISPNVFVEQNSLGLFTGLINTDEGIVLIDCPLRQDDSKNWHGGLTKMAAGDAKFLVNLDTNYDRSLSTKGGDVIVIAQANAVVQPKARQAGVKIQEELIGMSDSHDQISSSSRCLPPDITFIDNLTLNLGNFEICLEHHAGSNNAGTWAILPKRKIVFVGDAVLVDQPPFLAFCDLNVWIEDISLLASKVYKGYQIISARSGNVDHEEVKEMGHMLLSIQHQIVMMEEKKASLDEFLSIIPKILKRFDVSPIAKEQYYNRLRWGLATYYENKIK